MRKSVLQRQLLALGILVAALTIVVSAWACVTVASASVSLSCNGVLTISVSGFTPISVNNDSYSVTINGQTSTGSFPIGVDQNGNFTGNVTTSVGALTGNVSASGTVTVGDSGPVDITFTPNTLSCPTSTPPPCVATATNSSNFNGTFVPAGSFLWFNANFTAHDVPSSGVTIDFTKGNISFTAGGTPYSLAGPQSHIYFFPTAPRTPTHLFSATNTRVAHA